MNTENQDGAGVAESARPAEATCALIAPVPPCYDGINIKNRRLAMERLRSTKGCYITMPLKERFWSKVSKGTGCWEWQAATDGRYGKIWIGTHIREEKAHRIAWYLRNGTIPKGLRVLHHCDNPKCVNPDHLFLGTQKDNIQDAAKKGRLTGVLCEREVRQIRSLYARGPYGHRPLAKQFGVSRSLIRLIVTKQCWKWVS